VAKSSTNWVVAPWVIMLAQLTRSSATAEKQHVSCTYISL